MHNTDGAPKRIKIHGARVHNLKNINVEIPLNQIVGIAGVSGSGKCLWRWALCMPKAPDGIWNRSRPTPDGG